MFIGFIAKGAYDLVDELILFGATDISVLQTPLWILQGLWASASWFFSVLIILLLIQDIFAFRRAAAAARPRRCVYMRTYQEEAAEALEAIGAEPKKGRRTIAILFLLVLVGLTVVLSFTGEGPGNLLIWQSLLLVGLFCLFFGAGIYVAGALGVLGLIVGFAFWTARSGCSSARPCGRRRRASCWSRCRCSCLWAKILLRAGLSSACTARSMSGSTARRAAGCTPTSRPAGRFRRSPARRSRQPPPWSVALPFFQGTRYDNRHGAGLARGRRRARHLVPPGITFIIYALITETRSSALDLAAVGPSLLAAALFILVIFSKAAPRRRWTQS